MTSYYDAVWTSIHKIENTFSRDDISSVSRKDLATLILSVYDILSDSVTAPDWWERDDLAETEARERILSSLDD